MGGKEIDAVDEDEAADLRALGYIVTSVRPRCEQWEAMKIASREAQEKDLRYREARAAQRRCGY